MLEDLQELLDFECSEVPREVLEGASSDKHLLRLLNRLNACDSVKEESKLMCIKPFHQRKSYSS